MNTRSPKTLLAAAALAVVIASPLALAQSAASPTQAAEAAAPAATPAAAPAASAADTAPASPAASTNPAATGTAPGATVSAAAPARKTWAELDTDKNGSLSKTEAGAMEALAAVFDKADADADGALTGAEYKAYVAAANSGAGKQASGMSKK